jgi:hypothetical protein
MNNHYCKADSFDCIIIAQRLLKEEYGVSQACLSSTVTRYEWNTNFTRFDRIVPGRR